MKIPFTLDQFLQIFTSYNESIWPAQLVLNSLALVCLYFIARRLQVADKFVSLSLTALWLWTGIVYHWMYFTLINPAAYFFGALCVIQAGLFVHCGIMKNHLQFRFTANLNGVVGLTLISYALIIYPVLGYLLGHLYPSSPTFGAPCPTTIFTFGILLLVQHKLPRQLIIVPTIWALVGFTAALTFGMYEDYGLLLSAVMVIWLVLFTKQQNIAPVA